MCQLDRVICIVKLPPPINGATNANLSLYKSSLLNRKFNCHFINYGLTRANKKFGRITILKVVVYSTSLLKLFKALLFKNISLVYITISPTGFAFFKDSLFILLARIAKRKVLIHLHGQGIIEQYQKNKFWKFYYPFVFKKCKTICLTERLKKDICFFYKDDPYIVPNGIQQSNYDDLPSDPSRRLQILFLSNLYSSKGVFDLIEAISIVNQKVVIDFSCVIVGQETTELSVRDVQDFIMKKGCSHIINVLGPKFDMNKLNIYKNSSIFVFPSYVDSFGIVNIEAMQAGLPIIATDIGGIPDIVINTRNGFIVQPGHPEQLAEKLILLLEDPILRKKIGEQNKSDYKQKYTLEKFESNMSDVFYSVIKSNK